MIRLSRHPNVARFQKGKAHGEGSYKSKQSKYTGEWHQDLKHGKAKEVWEDKTSYAGANMYICLYVYLKVFMYI